MATRTNSSTRGANALQVRQEESLQRQVQPRVEPLRRPKPIDEAKQVRKLYTSMLLSVIMVVVCMSVFLLKAEFTVSKTTQSVYDKEQQLTKLKEDNGMLEGSIVEKMDYHKIYERALALGMKLPNAQEVTWINPEPTSFTEQYIVIKPDNRADQKTGSFASFMFMGW